MKLLRVPLVAALVVGVAGLGALSPCLGQTAAAASPIRVLLVHGGHDFETNQFLEVFKANPEVRFEVVHHPQAQARWKADAAAYDVLVFYDMWQLIDAEAKANLVARLKEGKGLVALHHSLVSYEKWDEYGRIIGGRYHLGKWSKDGVEQPASIFKHGVDFTVRVADPAHPVTRGVHDFAIHDETYGHFEVGPGVHALLTTDEPTSGRVIGWAKTYEAARVVYLQLGHDHAGYENPNYRRLVAQAIRWAAKRDQQP
jgi:type 1 glutamine amidotransferase